MAVHHDKIVMFLRAHKSIEGLKKDKRFNWSNVGRDYESISSTFSFLLGEIEAGTFD